jgi:NAD-dependent DNA ligase
MNKLENQLRKYDEAYYHGIDPLISDQEYDSLVTQYELLYGPYVKMSNKEQLLPMNSPSLNKIKSAVKLLSWDESHPGEKILSDKIDGMSIIINYSGNKIIIYTHSDSTHGSNISHLLPYLNIPKNNMNIIVRGEMTIKLSVFEKYKHKYKSPRNMISGVINKKLPDIETLKDLTFLVFQVENGQPITPEEQFNIALKNNFNIVTGIYKLSNLNYDHLKNDLQSPCDYPRDGKTIAYNVYEAPTVDLPLHKIAFKILGETAETTVINVEWNESRNCLLKPRINIESIYLDDGDLSWTSGFNAKFIKYNHIGPGTKLLMTRSGSINPYIVEVLEGTKEQLPSCDFTWDKTQTNIVCEINDNVLIKRLYYFVDLLGGKYLGLKVVSKLYHGGFTTIIKLLSITLNDLINIKGILMKGAERIIGAIKTVIKNMTLSNVMVGSSLFPGFGLAKIDSILTHIPRLYNILINDDINNVTLVELKQVPGINNMADLFLEQLDDFKDFLNEIKIYMVNPLINNLDDFNEINKNFEIITPPLIIPEYRGEPLKGMFIVFSGDKKLTNKVKELGAIVDSNVKKQTTLLVVDQVGTMNNKEKTCLAKKIPIMSLNDFKEKYEL